MKKIKIYLKRFFDNKIIAFGIVPFFLISFWFLASIFFNNKISFSVLIYNHPQAINKVEIKHKLIKGKKVTGSFVAKDNYLGIVLVNFEKFIKPDFRGEDVLAFRIKEKGAKDWYYFNNYRSGLLQSQLQFPFGFPPIGLSKGRTYQFEIESVLGNSTNAVSVGSTTIMSGSQMPKKEILGSKLRIISFLIKKVTTSFVSKEFIFSSFIYLLPFLLYVIWQMFLRNLKVEKNKLLMAVASLITLDILILKEYYLGIYLTLLLGCIVAIIVNKIKSSVIFSMAFGLLFFWIVTLYFNINGDYSKVNVWVYTFFIIGTIQIIIEERKVSK